MKIKVLSKVFLIILFLIIIEIFLNYNIYAIEPEDLPSSFNLADNYNLKIENQGSEGNCWAFASLNSLETYLMMHGYGEYDFSEKHLSYIESTDFYNTRGQKSNRQPNDPAGGDFEEAMDYITNGYGPVSEEDFPYNEDYTINDYERLLDVNPLAYVSSYVRFPIISKEEDNKTSDSDIVQIRNQVKEHIMNNGSVAALVISPQCCNDIYNENTSSEYIPHYLSEGEQYGDVVNFENNRHIVSIIGWDDNYSKENFNESYQPENDGAYIVLNSWGKEFGDNGIFYVSYEDKYIEKESYGIIEASTNKNELNNSKKIKFNDERLYQKLKENLKRKLVSFNDNELELTLTEASINSVENLDLSNAGITDITGINEFKNLKTLDLSNNNITVFSTIKDMKKIEELYLNNCGITDISNIFTQEFFEQNNNNKEIFVIDLSENQISHFEVLSNFSVIKELNLLNTGLDNSKLLQLKDIKVNTLNISNNTELTDISTLNSLVDIDELNEGYDKNSLCNLDISHNKNIDLTTIPAVLEGINLSDMDLSNEDLRLLDYQKLNNINLSYNNSLTSLNNIENKENIKELDLSGDTNVDISSIANDFPWIDKLSYRDNNITSILPLLQYREIENEYVGTIKKGIQILDLSYNNIDLSENDFEQLEEIINSSWIYEINLSHNKTKSIDSFDTNGHYFRLDLSYNNLYPYFYVPDYVGKIDGQNYVGDINIDSRIVNDFKDIAQNLNNIYNTRYALGVENILEIDGAYYDNQAPSFIITNNPGEQATVKINGGKYKNSIITYNIQELDDNELLDIFLAQNPTHRLYVEGDDFDSSGMKTYGIYRNNSYSEIIDYEILNGTNLQSDQGNIIIKKDNKELYLNVLDEIEDYYDINDTTDIIVYKANDIKEISFEEKALYEIMCNKLNNIIKKDEETNSIILPKTELEKIYNLVINSDEIKTLNGIENIFPNLSSVELNGKNIENIESLKDYNLDSLEIKNNEALNNLNILENCDSLSSLTLKNTKITDINKLSNLYDLTIDSKTLPDFDNIKDNLSSLRVSQRVLLSDIETSNNKHVLPTFLQDVFNNNLPSRIQERLEYKNLNSHIFYMIRSEDYAKSTITEDIELDNNDDVWSIDLTHFIEDDEVKNRYIKISVDIMGEWGSIANYSYIINNDEAKVIDYLEIESDSNLVFEDGEDIDFTKKSIYKVYTNGEKELIDDYTLSVNKATLGLESITLTYTEDGIDYELTIPIEVVEHVHKWGEWNITKYPTVNENGEKLRVCTKNSSHIETEVIDKIKEDENQESDNQETSDSEESNNHSEYAKTNNKSITKSNSKSPQTGDNIMFWFITMCMSTLGIIVVCKSKK